MPHKFIISFSSSSKESRPPLSYRVREYYSSLLEDKLFKEKLVVLKDGWCIDLVLMFMEEAPRFKTSEIVLGKGFQSVKSEKIKIYNMIIPLKLIAAKGNSLEATLEVLQQALAMFFTETFKRISLQNMMDCWKDVDLNYLKSLPYPAPIKEQKYVGDILREDGTVNIYQF